MAEQRPVFSPDPPDIIDEREVPPAAKRRIHDALQKTLEEELKKEAETLGVTGARPAIHGSVHGRGSAARQ